MPNLHCLGAAGHPTFLQIHWVTELSVLDGYHITRTRAKGPKKSIRAIYKAPHLKAAVLPPLRKSRRRWYLISDGGRNDNTELSPSVCTPS
jgi:hypothetical protein